MCSNGSNCCSVWRANSISPRRVSVQSRSPSGSIQYRIAIGSQAGRKALEDVEYDAGTPAPGEIAIAVAACGVCRTDLQLVEVDLPAHRLPVVPAFAGLEVDAVGFLWVAGYRGPGDDRPTYEILDPQGAWVGRVVLPPGAEILEIGFDYLLVLQRDELDVEYVRLFALTRPAGQGASALTASAAS